MPSALQFFPAGAATRIAVVTSITPAIRQNALVQKPLLFGPAYPKLMISTRPPPRGAAISSWRCAEPRAQLLP